MSLTCPAYWRTCLHITVFAPLATTAAHYVIIAILSVFVAAAHSCMESPAAFAASRNGRVVVITVLLLALPVNKLVAMLAHETVGADAGLASFDVSLVFHALIPSTVRLSKVTIPPIALTATAAAPLSTRDAPQ